MRKKTKRILVFFQVAHTSSGAIYVGKVLPTNTRFKCYAVSVFRHFFCQSFDEQSLIEIESKESEIMCVWVPASSLKWRKM